MKLLVKISKLDMLQGACPPRGCGLGSIDYCLGIVSWYPMPLNFAVRAYKAATRWVWSKTTLAEIELLQAECFTLHKENEQLRHEAETYKKLYHENVDLFLRVQRGK